MEKTFLSELCPFTQRCSQRLQENPVCLSKPPTTMTHNHFFYPRDEHHRTRNNIPTHTNTDTAAQEEWENLDGSLASCPVSLKWVLAVFSVVWPYTAVYDIVWYGTPYVTYHMSFRQYNIGQF